jgi:hypothetical protein
VCSWRTQRSVTTLREESREKILELAPADLGLFERILLAEQVQVLEQDSLFR